MSLKGYDRPLEHKEYIRLKYLSQNDDKETKKKVKKKKIMGNNTKKYISISIIFEINSFILLKGLKSSTTTSTLKRSVAMAVTMN